MSGLFGHLSTSEIRRPRWQNSRWISYGDGKNGISGFCWPTLNRPQCSFDRGFVPWKTYLRTRHFVIEFREATLSGRTRDLDETTTDVSAVKICQSTVVARVVSEPGRRRRNFRRGSRRLSDSDSYQYRRRDMASSNVEKSCDTFDDLHPRSNDFHMNN